jgi:hypothetical protein
MRDGDRRDSLAEDVEYVGQVDELPLCELEYQLDVHVQLHTLMGVLSTNIQHRTVK